MQATRLVLRWIAGNARRVGVASVLLVPTSALAATGTVAPTSKTQMGATAAAATPKLAAVAKPVAVKPTPDAKVAQLQLSLLRPEQVRVDSVNPAVPAPLANATENGTTINVQRGQQLILRSASAPVEPGSPVPLAQEVKARLSSTLVVGVPDPVRGTVARQFQPFLSAEVSPLRWDAQALSYVTTVVVGLDPLAGDAERGDVALPSAIRFQLTGENVTSIVPPHVDVSQVGVGGYQRFRISTGRFDQAIRINAHSRFGDKSYEASVDPGPAQIELGQSDASVDGFGLGKTTISVRQRAANRQAWPGLVAQEVQLKTTGGVLTPPSAQIPANSATGKTELVSMGWGRATVSETNAAAEDASTATVQFVFPWLKFLLGFLGAALAGVLRVFASEQGSRQGWVPVFVGCLASGITVDILVALGAPLAPEWLLSMMRSELAWLAIGLVAGYPGVASVAWLGQKIFGLEKPEPANASERVRSSRRLARRT